MFDLSQIPSPIGLTREEILDLLLSEEYGYPPSGERRFRVEEISRDRGFSAGKANLVKLAFTMEGEFGSYTFPLYEVIPEKEGKHPAFLHINFRDSNPDKYQHTEEIVDNGFAIFTFCYKDVTSDDGDFTNGLAGVLYKDGKRAERDGGKIALWAWTASFVMDYIQTKDAIDSRRISVTGHSRLGKTALLAGALDPRFYCAISNDSGCSGAAISRNKGGESVQFICKTFPYWFNEHYPIYSQREDTLPFDQHFLLAANAPHRVYIASAELDDWACPRNEYLSARLASAYYESQGLAGLVSEDEEAVLHKGYHDGNIAYHLRAGTHYFSRTDWLYQMDYLKKAFENDK